MVTSMRPANVAVLLQKPPPDPIMEPLKMCAGTGGCLCMCVVCKLMRVGLLVRLQMVQRHMTGDADSTASHSLTYARARAHTHTHTHTHTRKDTLLLN